MSTPLVTAVPEEEAAFRAFLERPRVRAWTRRDPARVARLRDEFHRTWVEHMTPTPAPLQEWDAPVVAAPAAQALPARAEPSPFEVVFGPGRRGYVTAGLVLAVPLAVHLLLWGLRRW